MPYIKHYGANPPGSIAEHVQYEDPEHPSRTGQREARTLVCTRCEEQGMPRDQWDRAYLAYVLETPYEGMRFVGGVGLVDVERLRPFDVIITAEEYASTKAELLAANEAYKQRTIEKLTTENDPTRRAHPEHEAMGWRTRVWILSFVELTHHVPYRVDGTCWAYARVRQYAPNGSALQLVDLYHRSAGSITQAILDGVERADRFTDLLAIAGFGGARVVGVVGTSPPTCRSDVPFTVATLQASIVNTAVAVPPEVFEGVQVNGEDHVAVRHVRDGLSAHLPTVAFASFWNAMERTADQEARDLGRKRTVRCRKCGDERQAGWDIKTGFEAMYGNAGLKPEFDHHRGLRGRVQHGDAIFSDLKPSEFLPDVSKVQSAAIVSVGTRIGLQPQVGEYLDTTSPVVAFECTVRGGTCEFDFRSFEVNTVPSLLPMRASANRGRIFRAGVELPPKVDPLIVPALESNSDAQASEAKHAEPSEPTDSTAPAKEPRK